jgi:Zn-finger nucleic acid-binding protein
MERLTCPKCREETLERRMPLVYRRPKGKPPVQPARCTRCHGFWLTRDQVAEVEARGGRLELEPADTPPPDPEVDRRGGLCPDCRRILVRAPIEEGHGGEGPAADPEPGAAAAEAFYLDRCAHCGGIWFDAGEWRELAGDPVTEDLSRLWDPDWRRHRLAERNRRADLARLEERLGAPVLEAVDELVRRLAEAPDKKAAALAHLHEELGYEPPDAG